MPPNAVVCIPDARLRSLIALLLADAGAVVASCPDADEAQRVLASRFCQLGVLLQGAVPDTAAFLAQARQVSPDTKFLLIANREEVDAVLPLFAHGLGDALLQPLNPKRAVSALHRLLGLGQPKAGLTASPFPLPLPLPGAKGVTAGATAAPFATETEYRPLHLVARSPAMRRAVREMWTARGDPVGLILRGEPGAEFELAAREFQAMGGDSHGGLVVIGAQEFDVDTLATQISLDRLQEGVPRTYFVPEVEKLPKEQEKALLEFLRRARRQREREKPLRIVFAAHARDEQGVAVDSVFLEELQFIVPAVVALPSLRERREDIAPLVRRMILDLTALFPAYRARSVHPAAMQWLEARAWRGNHQELLAVVRQAVADCPKRELSAAHFGKLTEVGEARADAEELAAARVLDAVRRASPV